MLIDTQGLTAEAFNAEIGQVFTAETVPDPVQLTLHKLVEGTGTNGGHRQPFALIFTSPMNVMLLEAQYRLKSASGLEYLLYLSQIVSPGDGLRHYQAQFN
ncbi:DUF6916 family protein [Salinicola endophyticus]|uniref:DUF6916 family protein n=1 Tax=Salinicola endophyticus TaxID=1949083 RepID=UPI000DA1E99E|nr:hypothetical protein [Salinicola endophyticus]